MINRNYIKCETCHKTIITRVVIGHNETPKYVFSCPYCGENITLGLKIDTANVCFCYEFTDNCSQTNKDESARVVNLSSEIPIDERRRHDKTYFPFMNTDVSLFGTAIVDFNVEKRVHDNWRLLKKGSNQTIKRQRNVAKRFIDQYEYVYIDNHDKDLYSELFDFIHHFLVPNRIKYVDVIVNLISEDQKKFGLSYGRFFDYYIPNIFERYFERIIDVINVYMKNFESLYPILLYLRGDRAIPDNISASSFDFESLKKYYGDSFELIADLFEVLTCVNNINERGEFDKFKELDIVQYKNLDKANRANTFKHKVDFYQFAEEFDPQIRNASHHGNMKFCSEKNVIVYSYGKPLKEKEIQVSDYIISCNLIFINIVSIFMIMLYLNEFSLLKNKKYAFN